MEPVAVPAPAQVAPKRVDTLVLAAAVVLGALVLVCGDQRTTVLRGTTNMGALLTAQGSAPKEPLPGSLPDHPQRWLFFSEGEGGAAFLGHDLALYIPHAPKVLDVYVCLHPCSPPKPRSSLKDRLILVIILTRKKNSYHELFTM